MTPLEAIGYAVAALIVSPVVLAIAAGVVFVGFGLGLFVLESDKAQALLVLVGLIYGGTRLLMWGASRPPAPPETCEQRCDDGSAESYRLGCLQSCYESQELIRENSRVKQ